MALVYGRNLYHTFLSFDDFVWVHRSFEPESVGPGLGKEMQASGDTSVATPFGHALNVFFPKLRLLSVIGTIVFAPFAWFSRWRMSFVFCVTLVFYNQAMAAVLPYPQTRHTFYIVAPLLAALTMELKACFDRFVLRTSKA
jgi:hypothetical protein